MSGKVVIISTTLGVLAAGTGISLAATQGSSSDAVTCIVTVDAKAAVDANSALSDVFPVGTPLHLTSAGREVDVTVSAPLTAAAPTSAAPTTAPATTSAAPSDPATADPTATTSAPASGKPTKKHHRKKHKPTAQATAKPTTSTAAAQSNAEKAAQVGKVSIKAAANKGVDPNTVCVELSKNAFNVLGNVANGNNVGAFIATMTPTAAAPAGGAAATTSAAATSAPATSAPAASSSAATGATAAGAKKKHHHH